MNLEALCSGIHSQCLACSWPLHAGLLLSDKVPSRCFIHAMDAAPLSKIIFR